jgi:hypothetical protein
MIKHAFKQGVKQAFDDAGLTPEQIQAAQRLYGVGGGVAGAGLGGLLGNYLGGRAAESFDIDPAVAKALGSGLGALAGGGLGGYAGSQYPLWKYKQKAEEAAAPDESALGALPISDLIGALPNYGYDDYGYGADDGGYGADDGGYGYYQ